MIMALRLSNLSIAAASSSVTILIAAVLVAIATRDWDSARLRNDAWITALVLTGASTIVSIVGAAGRGRYAGRCLALSVAAVVVCAIAVFWVLVGSPLGSNPGL